MIRRTKIKPISKKRKRESAIYRVKRRAFLATRPVCECFGITGSKGDITNCEITPCNMTPCDIHHSKGRTGKNYLDESTWIAVCRPCHQWIEENRREAERMGLIVREYRTEAA